MTKSQSQPILLNPNLVHFGAKTLERLDVDKHSDKEEACQSPILFRLRYKTKKDGPSYFAKMTCLRKEYGKVHHKHPGFIERDFLRIIQQEKIIETTTPFLPELITDLECPATSLACSELPTRAPGRSIWNHVVTTLVPFYDVIELYDFLESKPTTEEIQDVLFSILWTLMVLQDKYKFVHNDLHGHNVLIRRHALPVPARQFTLGQTLFTLPSSRLEAMVIDFELCDVHDSRYDFPLNQATKDYDATQTAPDCFDPYFDLHNLVISILACKDAPPAVNEWLFSIFPTCFYPKPLLQSKSLRPASYFYHQLISVLNYPGLSKQVSDSILQAYPKLSSTSDMASDCTEEDGYLDDDHGDDDDDDEYETEHEEETNQKSGTKKNGKNFMKLQDAFYTPDATHTDYLISNMSRKEISLRKDFPKQIYDYDLDMEDATRYLFDEKLRYGMIQYHNIPVPTISDLLLKDSFFARYRKPITMLDAKLPHYSH